MATPNYEQIQSFNTVTQQLIQSATDEFMRLYSSELTIDEVVELMTLVAEQYGLLASELGAQWYDLCTNLANIDAEPAEIRQADTESLRQRARWYVDNETDGKRVFNYFLQNVINDSIRETGSANLWRDYERGMVAGKWARVPVGETCAWCLMLASQGAWYLTKESALGKESGHYHDGCNCIAVYHSDPDDIPNYSKLAQYKKMYYDAENTRVKGDYSDDLRDRINRAKENHAKAVKDYEEGITDKEPKPWTKYNETLIIMRYQNEGLH